MTDTCPPIKSERPLKIYVTKIKYVIPILEIPHIHVHQYTAQLVYFSLDKVGGGGGRVLTVETNLNGEVSIFLCSILGVNGKFKKNLYRI